MENINTIDIKIISDHIKNAQYDFYAYSAVTKSGKIVNAKFTKDCAKQLPNEEGTFIFTVPEKAINKAKNYAYPTYWIKEIIDVKPFDFNTEVDEELPF